MDGLAAGSDADVWILCLAPGSDGWRRVLRGAGDRRRRLPDDLRCWRCRWPGRCAAMLRGAPGPQHDGRTQARRRGQLRLVAGVLVAGRRASAPRSRRRSSASPRRSTTSAACSTATPKPRRSRRRWPPTSIGWTFLAGGIIDRYARQRPTRAHGFFAAGGVYLLPLPAARPWSRRSSTGCCSATSTAGCSTTGIRT